jgi:CheY-like chemotaxis protein
VEESQQRIIQNERLRALGEMAGGVAHDFNNVLAVVLGRAQLLQRQVAPDLRRQLAIIEQVAQDGAQTVRRIQEFARMRRTRPWQHVDVTEIVREVVEATRPRWTDQAQARGVAYAMRLNLTPVPPVTGDPAELRESFMNLLFNALDAMPQGGALTFSTAVDRDRVVCVVEDTGAGMSEEVRRRCFEPFFTTKAEQGGTGLGLSIAYGIVTRHGGEIDVWSRPGEGSRFTVRLPVGGDVPARAPDAPPPRPSRRARILVVEDEAPVREVLVDVLAGQGHDVVACGDGRSALEHVAGPPFDLALVDLSMPGLSGWEVAKALRAAQPQVPIAMVTGWGDQIDFGEARTRGIDYLMAKPFNVDDMTRLVAGVLAHESTENR